MATTAANKQGMPNLTKKFSRDSLRRATTSRVLGSGVTTTATSTATTTTTTAGGVPPTTSTPTINVTSTSSDAAKKQNVEEEISRSRSRMLRSEAYAKAARRLAPKVIPATISEHGGGGGGGGGNIERATATTIVNVSPPPILHAVSSLTEADQVSNNTPPEKKQEVPEQSKQQEHQQVQQPPPSASHFLSKTIGPSSSFNSKPVMSCLTEDAEFDNSEMDPECSIPNPRPQMNGAGTGTGTGTGVGIGIGTRPRAGTGIGTSAASRIAMGKNHLVTARGGRPIGRPFRNLTNKTSNQANQGTTAAGTASGPAAIGTSASSFIRPSSSFSSAQSGTTLSRSARLNGAASTRNAMAARLRRGGVGAGATGTAGAAGAPGASGGLFRSSALSMSVQESKKKKMTTMTSSSSSSTTTSGHKQKVKPGELLRKPSSRDVSSYPSLSSIVVQFFKLLHYIVIVPYIVKTQLIHRQRWSAKGRAILITGASSGIGAEMARQYASQGARLALLARTAVDLEAVAKECRELGSGKARPYSADLSNTTSIELVMKQVLTDFGHFDVVVLNAGRGQGCAFEEINDPKQIDQMMKVNATGAITCLHYLLPNIPKSRNSRIVVISNTAGVVAAPYQSIYSATKHALTGFSNSLRIELQYTYGPEAPRVCLVSFPEVSGTRLNNGRMDMGADLPPTKWYSWAGIPLAYAVHDLLPAIANGKREFGHRSSSRRITWWRFLYPLMPGMVDRWSLQEMQRTHYRPLDDENHKSNLIKQKNAGTNNRRKNMSSGNSISTNNNSNTGTNGDNNKSLVFDIESENKQVLLHAKSWASP